MTKLRVRSLLCFSLLAQTLFSAPFASAAPARQSDDEGTVAIARERFREGVAFFDKKEYDKARVAFLQAYALKKHPAVLLNLAQSELRSNHEADAAKHFSAYMRDAKDATEAERQAAEAGLNATKSAIAVIDVSVDEPFSEVYLDSSLEGLSPLPGPLYVNPGTHSVEARKGGKSTATQLNTLAGKQFNAVLTFTPRTNTPRANAPAPAPVLAEPRAIEVEPESEHTEPKQGRKPFFKWLGSSPIGLLGAGLTGAGLGVGVGTALASNHAYHNADSIASQIKSTAATDSGSLSPDTKTLCSDPRAWLVARGYVQSGRTPDLQTRTDQYSVACSKYPDNVSKGDTLKTIATVSLVVGVAAAAGTVAYYFLDPDALESSSQARAPQRRIAVLPSLAPRQAGLTVVGSF